MKRPNAARILRAIGNIDDELVERAAPVDANETDTVSEQRPKEKVPWMKIANWLKWAAPIAACLVIFAAVVLPMVLKTPSPAPNEAGIVAGAGDAGGAAVEMPSGEWEVDSALYPANIDNIFGLPTTNYTWDEGEGMEFDRMATNELRYLMREFDSYDPNVKAAFAVIGVDSVERFIDDNEIRSEGQIAECGVLYDVLGDGIVQPLIIKQYLYTGYEEEGQTNLIRVGGVYVVPIVTMEAPDNYNSPDYSYGGDVIWSIYGDLDVLFEVDDKGLIHSHSRYPELNKYDGQDLATLWKDIGYLYMNPLLRSHFAEYISQGYEVVVDNNRIALYESINEWYGWESADAERFSAQINGDGRITIATDGFNIFRPVEGMTVDEMNDTVVRIKQFVGLMDADPPAALSITTEHPIDASEENQPGAFASPIMSPDKAQTLLEEEYARQGFGEVQAGFQSVSTLWETVDVYLFNVKFGDNESEFAGIVLSNGNLIRLDELPEGGFAAKTGALPLN
jgi:hypothetical protein